MFHELMVTPIHGVEKHNSPAPSFVNGTVIAVGLTQFAGCANATPAKQDLEPIRRVIIFFISFYLQTYFFGFLNTKYTLNFCFAFRFLPDLLPLSPSFISARQLLPIYL